MATVRQLTRLLSAHLGHDVTGHAARLAREDLIARRDGTVGGYDAATMLLAGMASLTPDQAVDVVDTLFDLPLRSVWRLHGSIPMLINTGHWTPERPPQRQPQQTERTDDATRDRCAIELKTTAH